MLRHQLLPSLSPPSLPCKLTSISLGPYLSSTRFLVINDCQSVTCHRLLATCSSPFVLRKSVFVGRDSCIGLRFPGKLLHGRASSGPSTFTFFRAENLRAQYLFMKDSTTSTQKTSDDAIPSGVISQPDVKSSEDGGKGSAAFECSSSMALPPALPTRLRLYQMAPVDQAFLLLGFIACLITGVFSALLLTAIPTLNAMRRAANSMEKLADVAREELPSTMAAIRLSGMEISDLTLELNDLSQEISDGVRSSARAVQAAEVGIRRMGALAATQTISTDPAPGSTAMLQERASIPVGVVRPAVVSAAQTTRQAMEFTQRLVVTLISHPRIAGLLGRRVAEGKEKKLTPDAAIQEITVHSENATASPLVNEMEIKATVVPSAD